MLLLQADAGVKISPIVAGSDRHGHDAILGWPGIKALQMWMAGNGELMVEMSHGVQQHRARSLFAGRHGFMFLLFPQVYGFWLLGLLLASIKAL